jgi:hypothetical protein
MRGGGVKKTRKKARKEKVLTNHGRKTIPVSFSRTGTGIGFRPIYKTLSLFVPIC